MAQLRFTTARDLFEAFETAREDIRVEPADVPSLEFLNSLVAAGDLQNAVSFCAYLLPRREAVWWACQSVRSTSRRINETEEAYLQAAEAWVHEPGEDRRLTALDLGMESDKTTPGAWTALAAAWSGGAMVRNEHNAAPAPPHATAKAVIAAILICTAAMQREVRDRHLSNCVRSAIRLAQGSAPGETSR
jgi:hypothetical protein